MTKEISEILKDIKYLDNLFDRLIKILPSFDVTDKKVLPYGLKPHTRSVSWLVEQVIVQQTKFRAKELGIDDVDFDFPDTCLHDCEIFSRKKNYYVNIKIHNAEGKENKNDIAAVEKLYTQYIANPNYKLLYAGFGIKFEGIRIHFDPTYLVIFSPQFMPIYINPRNDKIQATYHHEQILRSRKKFLELLKINSKSIILN